MSRFVYWGSGSPSGKLKFGLRAHEHSLTLACSSAYRAAWRVLLALEEKGLPYEGRMLSFSRSDAAVSFRPPIPPTPPPLALPLRSGVLKTPQFRALNPRGMVPIFVDGCARALPQERVLGLTLARPALPHPATTFACRSARSPCTSR